MARRKDTITQRDFSLGAVRPEAVERDDTSLIGNSVKEAKNAIGLTPGAMEIRPGSVHVGTTDSKSGFDIDLGSGRVYDLHIVPDGVILYNEDGTIAASFLSATWTGIADKWGAPVFADVDFWVVADPDSSSIIIGAENFPIHALVFDGTWSFGAMNFQTKPNGAVLQPYWNYYAGTEIQPSARTGAITLVALSPTWTPAHTGMRVRYGGREILLGAFASSTSIAATVVEELPPTYDFTVAATSGYEVGDAVEHDTLGGQGIITAISGSIITVLATVFWDGFTASGKLTAPNANQTISVMTSVAPAPSPIWDMQMQSSIHGYAGHAEKHMGRAYLCDFPGAPQGFAASVAGFIDDFTMGANDGDGFVETIGANDGGSLRYIVSAEDLLFFTSKGLYYHQTRDGSAVTPRSINPVRFSRRGCASVRPVAVDDGAVFVDAVGQQIFGALLTGTQYRSWTAKSLTKFHSHLISSPVYLGATSDGSEVPEEFIYVVSADGSAVVAQWDRDADMMGWRPWETAGSYKAIYQAFGKTYAVVERTINSVVTTFRERFETGIFMDCVASLSVSPAFPSGQVGVNYFGGVTAAATYLNGHAAAVYFEGWDLGDRLIDAAGVPLDGLGSAIPYPDYTGVLQIGLPFEMRITPWARRSVNSYKGKRDVKRNIGLLVTVQDSREFSYDAQDFGAYRAGEDLTLPPPLRSEEAHFITGGRAFFEDRPIVKSRPGPFRLLKLRYKVTI